MHGVEIECDGQQNSFASNVGYTFQSSDYATRCELRPCETHKMHPERQRGESLLMMVQLYKVRENLLICIGVYMHLQHTHLWPSAYLEYMRCLLGKVML
jgi:hypothetical protein